jgi:hypothetical protein
MTNNKFIRCIGYNLKNDNKVKCRSKINITNEKEKLNIKNYFCCEKHIPKNLDDVIECCDMCCEEVNKIEEIIILKCNHAYHKICYYKWLNKNRLNLCPVCMFSYKKHTKKSFKKKFINKNNKKKEIFNDYTDTSSEASTNIINNNDDDEEQFFINIDETQNLELIPLNTESENIVNKITDNLNLSSILTDEDWIKFLNDNIPDDDNEKLDTTEILNSNDTEHIIYTKINNKLYNDNMKLINLISQYLVGNCIIKDEKNINNESILFNGFDQKEFNEITKKNNITDTDINNVKKKVKEISDHISDNQIDKTFLYKVIFDKLSTSGINDTLDFDEYFDIKSVDEVTIKKEYYDLFTKIPDINLT